MAAIDRRELILEQLLTILGAIPGVVTVARNRGELQPLDPETGAAILPAIVLLDGVENAVVPNKYDGNTRQMTASLVELMPQIFVILKPTDDIKNVGQGEALSTMRMAILKGVAMNDTLKALLGSNGYIRYVGCLTDMQTGSSIQGQMQMEFAFGYPLMPVEFMQ